MESSVVSEKAQPTLGTCISEVAPRDITKGQFQNCSFQCIASEMWGFMDGKEAIDIIDIQIATNQGAASVPFVTTQKADFHNSVPQVEEAAGVEDGFSFTSAEADC